MKNYSPIRLAEKLRPRMIDPENKKILLAVLAKTEQAQDLTKERFFEDIFRSKIYTKKEEQDKNPFRGEPALVAAKKLTIPGKTLVSAEECNAVFIGQINGCNLKCWYCYVDNKAKSTNLKYGKFFTTEEYLTQFLIESRKTQNSVNQELKLNILRLSGGEVFIVPEIIFWMIESIEKFGLENSIYLWVDCNLSTENFYWKYLSENQRKKIKNFKNLGVCVCYKGFDEESFLENTCGATPESFNESFLMHKKLIDEGLDVYSYLYPVTSSLDNIENKMRIFIERLQKEIGECAPLRMTTPPIKIYGPTKERLSEENKTALKNQWTAMNVWKQELAKRFNTKELSLKPHEIPIKWRA